LLFTTRLFNEVISEVKKCKGGEKTSIAY